MIVQYTILRCDTIHFLEQEVNALIKKNWQPQGGAFYRGESGEICQAMVLIRKEQCSKLIDNIWA